MVQRSDPSADTFVTTDASCIRLGSVLTQKSVQGKKWWLHSHPVPHHIQRENTPRLRDAGMRVGDEPFRKFIWGRKFILRSDHKPLAKLLTTEGLSRASARIARLSKIAGFCILSAICSRCPKSNS